MKYCIKILIFLTSLGLGSLSAQTILHNWQFNDTVGTGLTGVANTGTDAASGGAFGADITGVQTDGAGNLAVNNSASSNSWLTTTDLAYTSGAYYLDARISNWNLTGNNPTSGLFVGFMQGNDSTSVSADFNITSDGSNMRLQSRIGDTTYSGLTTFSNSGTDLLIRLVLDLDAGNASLQYDLGSTGTYTTAVTESLNGRTINDFRFRSSADWSGADTLSLDYMTITQVPEPSTYAAIIGVACLAFVVVRRRWISRKA